MEPSSQIADLKTNQNRNSLLHVPLVPSLNEMFKNLDVVDLLRFSLSCKSCRNFVKDMRLKRSSIVVSFGKNIEIRLKGRSPFKFTLFVKELPENVSNPEHIHISFVRITRLGYLDYGEDEAMSEEDFDYSWNITKFSLEDWFNHLAIVFVFPETVELTLIREFFFFDINSIKQKVDNMSIADTFYLIQSCPTKFLFELLPVLKRRVLRTNSIDVSNSFNNILRYHFKKLRLAELEDFRGISLIGSSEVEGRVFISEEEWNLFLKHWINGSQRQLKSLGILDHIMVLARNMFKDIQWEPTSLETMEQFSRFFSLKDDDFLWYEYTVCDIKRCDGTKATILVFTRFDYVLIRMKVWN